MEFHSCEVCPNFLSGGQDLLLQVGVGEVEVFVRVEEQFWNRTMAVVVTCKMAAKLTIHEVQINRFALPSAEQIWPTTIQKEPVAVVDGLHHPQLVPHAAHPVHYQEGNHPGQGHLWIGARAGVPDNALDGQALDGVALPISNVEPLIAHSPSVR